MDLKDSRKPSVTMKKIAFFVEGQTEQIFVTHLIQEILGSDGVTVLLKKISGGTNAPKKEFIRSYSISRDAEFVVLIYDCGADNRVKTEILENIESLKEGGYSCIIGVRDLYPLSIDELPRLEKGLKFLPYAYRDMKDPFDIVVAVREVETWFLAETRHFQKIDKRLTGKFIEKRLGFNPYVVNPVTREHPSDDLNRIYKLVGRSYTKKYWQVERLMKKLDFKHIRYDISHQLESLNLLVECINQFKRKK